MEYVSFDLAKKLKEKGFNCPCIGHYVNNQLFIAHYQNAFHSDKDESLDAPTIEQVLKWLRKEKEIDIAINPSIKYDDNLNRIRDYNCYIFAPRWNEPYCTDSYDSYEQAAMVGIKFALDNLI